MLHNLVINYGKVEQQSVIIMRKTRTKDNYELFNYELNAVKISIRNSQFSQRYFISHIYTILW